MNNLQIGDEVKYIGNDVMDSRKFAECKAISGVNPTIKAVDNTDENSFLIDLKIEDIGHGAGDEEPRLTDKERDKLCWWWVSRNKLTKIYREPLKLKDIL